MALGEMLKDHGTSEAYKEGLAVEVGSSLCGPLLELGELVPDGV